MTMNHSSWPRSRRLTAVTGALLVLAIALAGCGGQEALPATPGGPSSAAGTGSSSPVPSAVPSVAAGPTASAPSATSPTVAEIARLQALVNADPADADAQRDLGFALVQRVRETADPSLYAPALAAFEAALKVQPDDSVALLGVAGVELGKHEFAAALVTAERAIDRSPSFVAAHAAKVDALVELGRYDEATEAAGVMFGLRSDLTTLARVSYLAELRGQLEAALAGMRAAAASPGLAPENIAYVQALLGNLLVYSGDPAGAAEAYRSALALVPDHAPSLAGQGRLAVAGGDLDGAIALFERASAVVPLPEYVIALGDTQTAAGRTEAASRSYELARAEIQLFKAAGVVVDVDLALLEADHGDPAKALADALAGHEATPTVRAADAVAWALHRLGRDEEARTYADQALRLGSIDPLLRYHSGAIAAALKDRKTARRDLEMALATDPGFSASGAVEARRILESLPPG